MNSPTPASWRPPPLPPSLGFSPCRDEACMRTLGKQLKILCVCLCLCSFLLLLQEALSQRLREVEARLAQNEATSRAAIATTEVGVPL